MATDKRRILGIDPGTNELGVAIIDIQAGQVTLVELDVVSMSSKWHAHEKLRHIYTSVTDLINKFEPKEVAVEAPFFGKNVQSMLKLGRAQGAAITAGMMSGLPVFEYAPRKIKQSVTGRGQATKEQVAAMLKQLIKADFSIHQLDATDALATAYCHFMQTRKGAAVPGKKSYSSWKAFLKDNPDRTKS